MSTKTIRNEEDGLYYTFYRDGSILVSKTPGGVPVKNIEPPEEPMEFTVEPTTHHLSVKQLDMGEICMRKYNFEHNTFFTDIYYNKYYEQNEDLKRANYICEHTIDFNYFSRYLNLRVTSNFEITDENTILINPIKPYDQNKYKNVIFTTIFLNNHEKKKIICSTSPKTIHVLEPPSDEIRILPEIDFMVMSNDYVYTPRQNMSVDDTFRLVFGHLMKHDSIKITIGMENLISRHIDKMKLFYNVHVIEPNTVNENSLETASGIQLYRYYERD